MRFVIHQNHCSAARRGERRAGKIYATSMAVLALAVEYRYLPIYQR